MRFINANARVSNSGTGCTVIFMGATYKKVEFKGVLVTDFIKCMLGQGYKDVLIDTEVTKNQQMIIKDVEFC